MHELEDVLEHREHDGQHSLSARFALFAAQRGRRKLDVPVAVLAPREVVHEARRLAEEVSVEQPRHFRGDLRDAVEYPFVLELKLFLVYLLTGLRVFEVHEREAARVPELVHEEAVGRNSLGREEYVAPLHRERREREAQRVRAVVLDYRERVDDVAARLAHLLSLFVADERVDVDVAERNFMLRFEAEHYHARDPEEDNIIACYKTINWKIPF